MIAATLRRAGADVITAGCALEALDLLPASAINILVSDIAMPDHDGYALIRRVRELSKDQGGQVPAIALTAYARDEDRARAISAGFNAHLAKPVDPKDLINRITQLAAQAAGTPVLRLA